MNLGKTLEFKIDGEIITTITGAMCQEQCCHELFESYKISQIVSAAYQRVRYVIQLMWSQVKRVMWQDVRKLPSYVTCSSS